jgi:hypothetical protein
VNTRWAKWIVGWGTATTVSVVIDEVMWTPAILWLGAIKGGLVMTTIALVVNLLLIWAYDTLKQDFLSFEALREVQEGEHKGFWKQLLAKSLKTGKVPAFVALSFYDPFIAVIWSRKSANAYRMTRQDWMNFGLAMIIACIGWTAICSGAACIIKLAWSAMFG